MSALPAWFSGKKGKPPTLEELRERATAAWNELQGAKDKLDEARRVLESERTPGALEGVRQAKQRAEDLAELAKIAQADLEAAELAASEAETARLRARAAELESSTSPQAVAERARTHDARMLKAVLALVALQPARDELGDEIAREVGELARVRATLGEPGVRLWGSHPADRARSTFHVAIALEKHLAEHGQQMTPSQRRFSDALTEALKHGR